MFARLKDFANRHSRLAMLRQRFNRWVVGNNAKAYATKKIYNKPFGGPLINKFNKDLRAAYNASNHNQAGNLERRFRNLTSNASRHVRNQHRLKNNQGPQNSLAYMRMHHKG
jgi:hypothetical protein